MVSMNEFLNLIYSVIGRFFRNYNGQACIKDYQYYDNEAFEHMRYYLSIFDVNDRYFTLSTKPSSIGMLSDFSDVREELEELVRPKDLFDEIAWNNANGPEAYKGGLRSFKIEDGIKRIGKYAFAYNLNLSELYLPSTLEEIDSNAFTMCRKLESIIIPPNVKRIGDNAFCDHLKELYIYANYPPKIKELGISHYCKIYIPSKNVQMYIGNRRWSKYHEQIIAI